MISVIMKVILVNYIMTKSHVESHYDEFNMLTVILVGFIRVRVKQRIRSPFQ